MAPEIGIVSSVDLQAITLVIVVIMKEDLIEEALNQKIDILLQDRLIIQKGDIHVQDHLIF